MFKIRDVEVISEAEDVIIATVVIDAPITISSHGKKNEEATGCDGDAVGPKSEFWKVEALLVGTALGTVTLPTVLEQDGDEGIAGRTACHEASSRSGVTMPAHSGSCARRCAKAPLATCTEA